MKHIIIVAVIAFCGTFGVSFGVEAAKGLYSSVKVAEVKGNSQTIDLRRVIDTETGAVCYFGFLNGNTNTLPTMSCVK